MRGGGRTCGPRACALAALLAVGGCDPGTQVEPESRLAIVVRGAARADRARILILDGPTQVLPLPAVPGQVDTVPSLLPGRYTVAVEGFAGDDLEWFDETTVDVEAGVSATVTLTARSFGSPAPEPLPAERVLGDTVELRWAPVDRAETYQAERCPPTRRRSCPSGAARRRLPSVCRSTSRAGTASACGPSTASTPGAGRGPTRSRPRSSRSS